MSRFFKRISDSESESSSSDEEVAQPTGRAAPQAAYGFSGDEEEAKRVVRSAKDKHYETIHDTIKQLRNAKKIKDFTKMLTEFEELGKKYAKAKPVVDKEEAGITPKFYTKILVELEDIVNEVWEDKDARKNLNKNNSKAFMTLRQKLRKYNKDFEAEIQTYRENPDAADAPEQSDASEASGDEDDDDKSESESESEESEDEAPIKPAKKSVKKAAPVGDGEGDDADESDDIDWDSSSESSDESSGDEVERNQASWFLKDSSKQVESKKREKKTKESRHRKRDADAGDEEDDGEGDWEKVRGGQVEKRERLFAKDAEITVKLVVEKLYETLAMRGKKKINRSEQFDILEELLTVTQNANLCTALVLKITFGIISCMYDYSSSSCMKQSAWNRCIKMCDTMISLLIENPNITMTGAIGEDQESFEEEPYKVSGCPLTLIERVDEEFVKILQNADPHSTEYIDRLRDETKLCQMIERLQDYYEKDGRGSESEICRIYVLRIDHIYYKFEQQAIDNTAGSSALMERLCKYIYSKEATNDRIKTQAVLSHIYHLSLHDHWFAARDLMLMTNLQQNIHKADIPLQVLYNRALVQLGLCAFRAGAIRDAHTALLDIQIMGRARELLAQGMVPRAQERTPEQERLEKRRQIPFHKHINIELLECVYLVSAMLLEIPDVAANEYNIRKKIISRSFYNQLRKYEDQPLVGVPESMREHVVAASKAMRVGNWQQCTSFIINDKMNTRVWNLFHQADRVREMLKQKIREESVRAYLFTYSNVYDSISIETLGEIFELDIAVVHSIVSKMIINEELMASLDEPTQSVVMHRTEPSRLQGLSLQLADKINSIMEQNERLWELRFGSGMQGMMGQQQGGGGRYDNQGDGQHGHHGGGHHRGPRGDRSGGGRHGGQDGQGGYDRSGGRGRGGYRNRGGGHHHHNQNRGDRQQKVRFN